MAKKQQSTGNSPLANLASKTDTKTATAASVSHLPTKNFTGQYFLQRFVTEKDEKTKLEIIKAATQAVDANTLKKSLDDMVSMAGKIDMQNGIPEKEVTKRGPVYKTAANNAAVIKKVYGALRFAQDALIAHGFNDTTGYHAASLLSKKALETKEIKWTGEKAKNKAQRDQDAFFREEARALGELKKVMPRNENESLLDYTQRLAQHVPDQIEQNRNEKLMENIDKEIERVLAMGKDIAKAIAEAVLTQLDHTGKTKGKKQEPELV
jgi:hypothetical protein